MSCRGGDTRIEKCELPGIWVAECRHGIISQGVGSERARLAIEEACEMVERYCQKDSIDNPLADPDDLVLEAWRAPPKDGDE